MSDPFLKRMSPMPRLIGHVESSERFGKGAVVLGRAPGRLDVMGGIADYMGSLVCEMPLKVAAGVAGQISENNRVTCYSAQTKRTVTVHADELDTDDHLQVRKLISDEDRWARYLIGCVWWIAHFRDRLKGVDLIVDSDVPLGAGVSSSAAVEVATMNVLCEMHGVRLAPIQLAAACQEVENKVVGAPCGVMDQVTSMLGTANNLLLIHCQPDEEGHPASIAGTLTIPKGYALVGVNSGVVHDVAGDPYTDTRVASFMAAKIITAMDSEAVPGGFLANVDVKRYARELRNQLPAELPGWKFKAEFGTTDDNVTQVVPDRVYSVRAAADHHVLEMSRVKRFVRMLKDEASGEVGADDPMVTAGQLMYESHRSYSHCANLGHERTDRLVELVQQAGPHLGFFGAKITGGGGGGTIAILMRDAPKCWERLRQICEKYEEESGLTITRFDDSGPGAAAVGVQVLREDDNGKPVSFL